MALEDTCLSKDSYTFKRLFSLPYGKRTIVMTQYFAENWARLFANDFRTLFIFSSVPTASHIKERLSRHTPSPLAGEGWDEGNIRSPSPLLPHLRQRRISLWLKGGGEKDSSRQAPQSPSPQPSPSRGEGEGGGDNEIASLPLDKARGRLTKEGNELGGSQ